MRMKNKNIIKMALLIIFIFHACSVTFFSHKHLIDGVVYVLSHPYQKDSNGNPTHTHDLVQINTIQILSHISIIPFLLFVCLQKITIYIQTINTISFNQLHNIPLVGNIKLRAPPHYSKYLSLY